MAWFDSDEDHEQHLRELVALELGDEVPERTRGVLDHEWRKTATIGVLCTLERCEACATVRTTAHATGRVTFIYPHPEGTRYADAAPDCAPDWWTERGGAPALSPVERQLRANARREEQRRKDAIRKGRGLELEHGDDDEGAALGGSGDVRRKPLGLPPLSTSPDFAELVEFCQSGTEYGKPASSADPIVSSPCGGEILSSGMCSRCPCIKADAK